MTTLADDIEALRIKLLETAEEQVHLVDSLAARLAEADGKLVDMLEQIVADQEARGHRITGLLSTIASRVGHLPRPLPGRNIPPPMPIAEAYDDGAEAVALAHHYNGLN